MINLKGLVIDSKSVALSDENSSRSVCHAIFLNVVTVSSLSSIIRVLSNRFGIVHVGVTLATSRLDMSNVATKPGEEKCARIELTVM